MSRHSAQLGRYGMVSDMGCSATELLIWGWAPCLRPNPKHRDASQALSETEKENDRQHEDHGDEEHPCSIVGKNRGPRRGDVGLIVSAWM